MSQSNFDVLSIVENESANPMNAENNYWGDASGPHHQTLNPNGQGAKVSGDVDFEPWAESLVECDVEAIQWPVVNPT